MEQLKQKRNTIDEIDSKLLELLGKRILVSIEIGKLKSENNMPVFSPEREKEMIARLNKQADEFKLDNEFINTIWNTILKESHRIQNLEGAQ